MRLRTIVILIGLGALGAIAALLRLGPSSVTRNGLISLVLALWWMLLLETRLFQGIHIFRPATNWRHRFYTFLLLGFGFLGAALYPPERFNGLAASRQRFLVPVWVWLAWSSFLLALHIPGGQWLLQRWRKLRTKALAQRRALILVSLLLWSGSWIIFRAQWGLTSPWPLNWQGFPVPILAQHVFVIGVVLLTLWWVIPPQWQPKSWIWGAGLWLVAGLVWMAVRPAPNYFLTPSYPPRNEHYPASDAAYYVLAAMQANQGYGYGAYPYSKWINYGHPFLSKFAVSTAVSIFQTASQTYTQIFVLWVALNALLGALAYALGSEIHSRSAGLALALLLIARETAAFTAANRLAATHAKNFMTEPLLRLLFVALTYALLRWWRTRREERLALSFLLGALLGWAVLTRIESFMLIAGFTFVGIGFSLRNRKGALALLAAAVGLFAVWTPWMMRTYMLTRHLEHPTPWFFGTKLRAAASSEYRPPPTPTPTPTPVAPPPSPNSQREDGPRLVLYSLQPGVRSDDPNPNPDREEEPTPLLERLRAWVQHVPILSSLAKWPREVWLHIWHYIGRNVITSWTMFPWTPRFYTALQVTYLRPLAEGRRLEWYHWPIWFFNLSIVALGLVAVWKRIRWAVVLPWLVYGFYLLGLSFARTGGGRYIVPIDWIPVTFYVVGWVVVLYGLAQLLGLSPSAYWWRWPERTQPHFSRRRMARWILWAEVLALFSALGVGLEAYHVWRSVQDPEPLPPRHRRVTLKEVLMRLDEWQIWPHISMSSKDIRAYTKSLRLVPEWGFAYFPRYVTAGEYCGDWCGYLTPKENLLFLNAIGVWGQSFIVIPQPESPQPWPLGSEMIALLCLPRKTFAYREAFLVVIKDPQGNIHTYVNPHLACDYDFQSPSASNALILMAPIRGQNTIHP